jgi:hypothetical protein
MGRQDGDVAAVRVQEGPGPVGPERSEPDRSGGPPEAAVGMAPPPAAAVPDPQVERPAGACQQE